MALKGNLRDFSTTQLLNLINLARKTGTLTIDGQNSAQMAFREGKLIHAHFNNGSNGSLASILQKSGKLSSEQANFIDQRAKGTNEKHLGHLLIQAGYVTQSDIIQSVRQNTLETMYKLFTWAEGMFRFESNTLPSADRITIPIDLESVIMEGSRRLKEWERLQTELPNLDVAMQFTDKPDTRLRNINLTVQEWKVISFINPQNSIRQIAEAAKLSEFEIRRIIYGMLQAGLIEFVDKTGTASKAAPSSERKMTRTQQRTQQRQQRAQPQQQAQPGAQPQHRGTEARSRTQEMEPSEKRSIVHRLINRIRGL